MPRLQHFALRSMGGVRSGQMRSRRLRCRDGERRAHRELGGARGGAQGLRRRDPCAARGAPERRARQLLRRASVCARAAAVSGRGCVRDDQPRGARARRARAVARGAVCDMSADDDGGLRNTLYRTTTRSGRRMTRARRWLYRLAVPLGLAIIRAWWFTCRVTKVEGVAHLDEALARAPSLVPCYWHQHQLYCGKFLVQQRGLTVGWLISPSVDGEIGAMMVRRLGAVAIRGSSTHTGARALRDYYQALVKDNISPVITP